MLNKFDICRCKVHFLEYNELVIVLDKTDVESFDYSCFIPSRNDVYLMRNNELVFVSAYEDDDA